MTENKEQKTRYFYPYCGYRLGFCLALWGCCAKNKDLCNYFTSTHPYTGQKPIMVSGFTGGLGTYILTKRG